MTGWIKIFLLMSLAFGAAILWKQPELTKFEPAPIQKALVEKRKRIIAVGDISCAPNRVAPDQCKGKEVANAIKKAHPDMVLVLGDLQYNKGEPVNFQMAFAPLWQDLKNKSYAVPGNHEYYTKNAAGYYDYWGDVSRSGAPGKGYYSFNFDNWHIIGLNSNCEFVACSRQSEQLKWLKNDLAVNPAKCTVAMWHHPKFTSGKYHTYKTRENSTLFWQELDASRADIILNGHEHLYERFARRHVDGNLKGAGIRQFTVGTGGKSPLYQIVALEPGTEKNIISHGFLQLDVDSTSYRWAFININGEVLDRGYNACS